ncbi:spermidine/putrescine-binding periplasmic protein 2 [Mycolicibacterium murale]|uniref:Spermidine/putrescine-binding periplasmic protein 2 n=1 Tax=Mycolicibacterium murale TaxID=182220 RepID=A0A7I9WGK0_9MYCO|nr:spermidine/putrescine ABC transporter substrate-binding protein [Mycolicibacterium murale]MCV7180653.1 spermidine/putrescine ABC transporter substrate-binding protein [Mycolicibacterium murale]GFG56875.1 spermidine/putrescine-binding periplasmic protein 2 [Mycolicibacterium murale]
MRKQHVVTVLAPEQQAGQIRAALTRRQALVGLGAGAAALALAACGTSGPQQSSGSSSTPAALNGDQVEGQLVIGNYADYISEDNVSAFTAAVGPEVRIVTYSSGLEMISALASGSADYDIVVPGPSETVQLIDRGLLRQLDKSLLPNIKNIRPGVMGLEYDPENQYAIPKAVGVAAFWWNTATVQGSPTSLAEVFDLIKANPEAKVNFFSGAKETFTLALAAIGKPIGSTDPADIEAAKQLLISVKPMIDSFGADELEGGTTGSIDICMGYNYIAKQINAGGGQQVQFLLPETGSTEYFIDNWAIAGSAKNPVAAHKFIDYVCAPEPAGEEMNATGTLVPVEGIEPFVEPGLIDDPTINIPPALLEKYEILLATPEYLDVVTKAYDEFRAA